MVLELRLGVERLRRRRGHNGGRGRRGGASGESSKDGAGGKDAKALVPLLRLKGYTALGDADTSSRAEDNSVDKAMALYQAKMIRIVLVDPMPSQTTTSTVAGPRSTPQRPKKSAHRTLKKPVQTASQ